MGGKCGLWILMALQVLALGLSARANVVLKPKGENSVELRIKRIEGRVQIRGQFAETTSVMTFANETSQRIEADFLSTLPDGATATYFAYWFGDEKVVARIVEKERALAIYQSITVRRRDPALVEMIGKNSFRARIFPVMPNADLRVEMRWVQVLASTPTGLEYRFPLAPAAKGKGVLDDLDLHISVDSDQGIISASNNYHQPIARENGGLSVQMQQQNFQPTDDFTLKLEQRAQNTPPPSLRANLFAAPSSGADGFFALAVTSNRNVPKPQLKIRGMKVYDLAPAVLPALQAGRATVICGRYKGSGTGTIEIAGLGTARVEFGAQAENNNLATRLWAAQRIEDLSDDEKNFEAVFALSNQFGLPSKWSSWLAVPQSELERFKGEKLRADLQSVARRYANEVARNGETSRAARQLKTQFETLNKQLSGAYALGFYARDLSDRFLQQQAMERAKAYPDARRIAQLEAQIERMKQLMGDAERKAYETALHLRRLDAQMSAWSQALLDEELAGRGNDRRAASLRAALERNAKNARYTRDWEREYRSLQARKAEELADEYVRNLYEKRDAATTRRTSTQLRNLLGRHDAHAQMSRARVRWAIPLVSSSAADVAEEKTYLQPNAQKISALEAKIARLSQQGDLTPDDLKSLREQARSQWAYTKINELQTQLAQAKYVDADAKRTQQIQARIDRVLTFIPNDRRYEYQRYALLGLMLEAKQAYDAQLKNPKPDPKTLRELEARMAKIYAAPEYQGVYGDWSTPNLAKIDKTRNPLQIPKIVELRTDFDNLDAQLRAQPNATQRAQLEAQRAEKAAKLSYATRYHLRLGDPLIAIDAPRDALQVVAVMPDGQIKRLQWNGAAGRWEARFDIPSYASEGAYEIRVIVVEKSGARHENIVRYNVDMTAPDGAGAARLSDGNSATLRLEIAGDQDTARVFALVADEKIELKLSPHGDNRFFALAPLAAGQKTPDKVTYILTDLAHNRTTIEVDIAR